MLIRLSPIVPEVQATLHLLCSPDVSASMSHCAEISLSPGCSLLQAWEWAAGLTPKPGLLFSVRGYVRFLMTKGCGELFARVTDVVSAGCADRTQRMQPVCKCASCLHLHVSPSPALALPSPQQSPGKISSNPTSLHAGGLPQRM